MAEQEEQGMNKNVALIPAHSISVNKEIILGAGSFGIVYEAKCNGTTVAVKIPQNGGDINRREFKREIEKMVTYRHRNICKCLGACIEPNSIMIVSERMKTSLSAELCNEAIPMYQKMIWAHEICKGVDWLHTRSPPLVHCDLKPANILLDDENHVKICDFGLSQILSQDCLRNRAGTELYVAPEVLNRRELMTEKVDIFSIGVILWELAVGNIDDKPLVYEETPDLSEISSKRLRRIIENCWSEKPEARYSAGKLAQELKPIIGEYRYSVHVSRLIYHQFWYQCFGDEEAVTWDKFVTSFYSCFLKQKIPRMSKHTQKVTQPTRVYRAIKGLLGSEDSEVVHIEAFGKLINWFCDDITVMPRGDTSELFLERIHYIVQQPYFHGELPTEDASNIISQSSPGSFLLRFSNSTPKGYCISYKTIGQTDVFHCAIPFETMQRCNFNILCWEGFQTLSLKYPISQTSKYERFQAKELEKRKGYSK